MRVSFFDTNILVYIDTRMWRRPNGPSRGRYPQRHQRSGAQREANVARRKMLMSCADTHALPTMLRGLLTVHPLTVEIHKTGLGLAERYGLSTRDAMIAASALDAGCDTLWSEDIKHGMMLGDRLRIVNLFRVAG
jgi:predicted nucleic acid-binding protein